MRGFRDGLRYEEISRRYGVSNSTVRYRFLLAMRDGELTERDVRNRYMARKDKTFASAPFPTDPADLWAAELYAAITPARQVLLTLGLTEDYHGSSQIAERIHEQTGVLPNKGGIYFDLHRLARLGFLDVLSVPVGHGDGFYRLHFAGSSNAVPAAFRMLSYSVASGQPAEHFLGKGRKSTRNSAVMLACLTTGQRTAELDFPVEYIMKRLRDRGVVKRQRPTEEAIEFTDHVVLPIMRSAGNVMELAPLRQEFDEAEEAGSLGKLGKRGLQLQVA